MLEKEIAFWERQKHIKLNEVQKQAVINSEGALLLLATPGSGKTTTMIMKIGYLIEVKGVQAEEIKSVTFSRVAAIEMKNRFKRFFPNLDSVDFSTIHSLAFKIVVEYFKKCKVTFRMIEGEQIRDKRDILRDIFKIIFGSDFFISILLSKTDILFLYA